MEGLEDGMWRDFINLLLNDGITIPFPARWCFSFAFSQLRKKLLRMFGMWRVVVSGCLLCGTGFGSAFFVNSADLVVMSVTACTSVGSALVLPNAVSSVESFVSYRHSAVVAFLLSFGFLGWVCMPWFVEWLLFTKGFYFTMAFFGGVFALLALLGPVYCLRGEVLLLEENEHEEHSETVTDRRSCFRFRSIAKWLLTRALLALRGIPFRALFSLPVIATTVATVIRGFYCSELLDDVLSQTNDHQHRKTLLLFAVMADLLARMMYFRLCTWNHGFGLVMACLFSGVCSLLLQYGACFNFLSVYCFLLGVEGGLYIVVVPLLLRDNDVCELIGKIEGHVVPLLQWLLRN